MVLVVNIGIFAYKSFQTNTKSPYVRLDEYSAEKQFHHAHA